MVHWISRLSIVILSIPWNCSRLRKRRPRITLMHPPPDLFARVKSGDNRHATSHVHKDTRPHTLSNSLQQLLICSDGGNRPYNCLDVVVLCFRLGFIDELVVFVLFVRTFFFAPPQVWNVIMGCGLQPRTMNDTRNWQTTLNVLWNLSDCTVNVPAFLPSR